MNLVEFDNGTYFVGNVVEEHADGVTVEVNDRLGNYRKMDMDSDMWGMEIVTTEEDEFLEVAENEVLCVNNNQVEEDEQVFEQAYMYVRHTKENPLHAVVRFDTGQRLEENNDFDFNNNEEDRSVVTYVVPIDRNGHFTECTGYGLPLLHDYQELKSNYDNKSVTRVYAIHNEKGVKRILAQLENMLSVNLKFEKEGVEKNEY